MAQVLATPPRTMESRPLAEGTPLLTTGVDMTPFRHRLHGFRKYLCPLSHAVRARLALGSKHARSDTIRLT